MSYLIDGNNVMAQRVGWHRDKAQARRKLLDDLSEFAKRRRMSIRVVFDGEPERHFADGSVYRGVRLFYAERGSDADERIKHLVEKERERRTLCVVTSDRALADYVRRCGARVMRSGEFRRRMDEALSEAQTPHAEPDGAGEDLNQWMRYFGVEPEDET